LSRKQRKEWRNRLETWGFRATLQILRNIPYALAEAFLIGLSKFTGLVLGVRRDIAEQNLIRCFPEHDAAWRRQVIAEMFEHFGRMTAETYIASKTRVLSHVRAEGWDNLAGPRADGRGVLLISAHFGNWELAARYIISRGIPLSVIVKRQRNAYFDAYTNSLREKDGIGVIVKEGVMRGMFDRLRRNEVVTFLSDQDARGEGVRMDFFGHPASVFTGPVRLAIKTGAAIVPGYAIREAGNHHVLHFHEPIITKGMADTQENVVKITRRLLDTLESEIREHPGLWFWVHKRWKGAARAAVVQIEENGSMNA
jgi:Kdo2-lipid IVA lauroyltransferase/acyltransferase